MRFLPTSSKDLIFELPETAKGGIISTASKVDCLQYQEHVARKNIEQNRIQGRLCGTPDKLSFQEPK